MADGTIRRAGRFTIVPEKLIRDPEVSDRAFRLWCLLDRYAGANGQAFPKRATLAEALDCSIATLDRAVLDLVEWGWLHKERREAGGVNDYTLLDGVSPLVTTPVLMGEDTPSSQVRTGLLTDDETQKEASLRENDGRNPSLRSGRKRKPETAIPESFVVDEDMKAWFAEQPWAANITHPGAETQAFIEHAKANDRRQRDWPSAWRKWMVNAGTKYARHSPGPSNVHHSADSSERVADFDTPTVGRTA